jgi:MerR family transcriptional regulator, light-induced transcriptional regulator
MYSVKAISTLTGLTAETLRAWERRYKTVTPSRDDGGRRVYSPQDLERLLLLAELTRNGHGIGKLSNLDNRQLADLSHTQDDDINSDTYDRFLVQITESILSYQMDRCEELLKRALLSHEPLTYVRNILAPALRHIGELWHEGKLSIAQEHLFSACVKRIVLSMTHNIHSLADNRPAMMFATPQGENHEFGILMTCLLASSLQYNCYLLGSDLPAEEIAEAARFLKPNVLVMSLINTPPSSELIKQLHYLSNVHDLLQCQLWIGGMGAKHLWDQQSLPQRYTIITDVDEFHRKAGQMKVSLGYSS